MEVIATNLKDVKILKPRVFCDDRGFFYETISTQKLDHAGISFTPVQENMAYSLKKGTVRGLHFQNCPNAQAKIVRCTCGRVRDYAVDLRKESPTYLQYVAVELSSENKLQLYIPRGFAHGVVSLEDDTTIEYFADNWYSPEHDRSIRCDDPAIGIDWGFSELILSEKDRNAPLVCDSDCNF